MHNLDKQLPSQDQPKPLSSPPHLHYSVFPSRPQLPSKEPLSFSQEASQSQPHLLSESPRSRARKEGVAEFLTRLRLEQYINRFLEEGFDRIDAVFEVTEADLIAMGVKRGHRRLLQHEIALNNGCVNSPSHHLPVYPSTHRSPGHPNPSIFVASLSPPNATFSSNDCRLSSARNSPEAISPQHRVLFPIHLPPAPDRQVEGERIPRTVPVLLPGRANTRTSPNDTNRRDITPATVALSTRGALSCASEASNQLPTSNSNYSSDNMLNDDGDQGSDPNHQKRRYRRHAKPDPNAPVKPPTAYVMFANTVRAELGREPNLSFSDIAKIVGNRWQALESNEREKYESAASKEKGGYLAKLAEYEKTPEYKEYKEYLNEFKARQEAAGSSATAHARKRSKIHNDTSLPIKNRVGNKDKRGVECEDREMHIGHKSNPLDGSIGEYKHINRGEKEGMCRTKQPVSTPTEIIDGGGHGSYSVDRSGGQDGQADAGRNPIASKSIESRGSGSNKSSPNSSIGENSGSEPTTNSSSSTFDSNSTSVISLPSPSDTLFPTMSAMDDTGSQSNRPYKTWVKYSKLPRIDMVKSPFIAMQASQPESDVRGHLMDRNQESEN
ncbi:uncharacterized protein VTP21DRAFT_10489 [Calcarisporiella thermophila]|uniref:uncharacterized protein n=1 Tax=Calcarisporiella thermophila TaxID=911321 RepID=UPI0037437B0D